MNRKKIMALIVASSLSIAIVSDPLIIYAFEQQEDIKQSIKVNEDNKKLEYTQEDAFKFDSAKGKILSYDKTVGGTDVRIPPIIAGVEVKEVGDGAFENKGLTSITLPNTVKSIGRFAFRQNNIESLVIPDSVIFIGWEAFATAGIVNLDLGKTLKEIPNETFLGNSIENLIIPDSVEKIGRFAFFNNNIKTVNWGSSLKEIGGSAFRENKIENLVIPEPVEVIRDGAFFKNNISSVKFPKTLTKIERVAFEKNKLTELNLSETNIQTIEDSAFSDNLLTYVEIPNSLVNVEGNIFGQNRIPYMELKDSDIRTYYGTQKLPELNIETESNASIVEIDFKKHYPGIDTSKVDVTSVSGGASSKLQYSYDSNTGILVIESLAGSLPSSVKFNYDYKVDGITILTVNETVNRVKALNINFFDYDNSIIDSYIINCPYGKYVTVREPNMKNERPGYTFSGWSKDPIAISKPIFEVENNTNFKAQYKANNYTVKFNLGDSISDYSKSVTWEEDNLMRGVPKPIKDGYIFKGWKYKEKNIDISTSLSNLLNIDPGNNSEIILDAKWKTNQLPVIEGLTDITIRKGETSNIETGVTANDNEDGDITANIVFPTTDLTGLAEGTHEIEYSVTDSDGNTTTEKRIVNVESNSAAVINGANDVTIKVGEVDSFDPKAGVTVTDDHDSLTIDNVTVTGAVGKPTGGKNESYELTYTVTDSDGNVTTVKRLVTVTNEVPVIEGLTDITIKKGQSANVETGVTASDNEDGDITGSIVFPTTDLTGLAEGTHEIEYTVTDSDGNITTEKRTVNVESNNAPVISGADDVTIKVGEMDTFDKMAGISVTDDHDSLTVADITWLGSGWLDKPMPGTEKECWILYTVRDSDGNETSVRRYVTVTNQLPVIEGLTDITIKEGETIDLVTGVISTDQEDGDITGKLVIPTIDTSIPGEYELIYTITDSDGNTTTVIRKVIVNQKLVEMNSVPTITGDNKTLKVGDLFDTMMGISAMDNEDGDITGAITIIENTVDTSRVGIYKVVYQVVDSAGAKVTKTISVTIRSNDIAVISGADDITIVQGDAFDSANGVTAMDTEDGNITPSMSITGNVDINTPGEYELIYTVTDSDGNTTTVIRKVIVNQRLVEMNNVPTITGDNKTLKVGDLFDTMMGISAMDNEDGDITGSITIIENTVDTSRVGTYKVVYQVVDSAGAKVTKTISVTVRSNDKAVISGADDITIVQGDAFDSANGVTAMDTEDGNITASMSITGTVDINNPGEYELVYTITDSDGNITTLIRKVIVQQKLVDINKIPVIFAEGIKIEVGSHFDPLSKVRAEDEEDGDITSKIKIIENTVNTNKAGVYSVTYEVTDSNGATVRKTIVITVEDKKIIIPNEENNNNKNDNKNDNNKNNTENRVTITKVSNTKKNQEKNVTTNRDDKKSEADKDSTSEGEYKEKNPKKPELGYEDGAEDENCMLHWLLLLLSVGTLGGTLVSRYRFNQKIKKEYGEGIDSTNGK